jgi:multidrug efflux pump subunit AcrA (membrane-fusion protein)
VILGFLSLTGWAARESLLPRQAVTVVPVVVARAEVRQAGTPLFQAAGWVEPRPTSVLVPALAEGVIEELLVVEGQAVQKGEPVARLIAVDAELELEQARSNLALRRAELASAQAARKAAGQWFETPVHLEAALAEAESQLAALQTELAKLPFLTEAAAAKAEFARQNYEGKRSVQSTSLPFRLVQKARSEHEAAQATLTELENRRPRLERQVESLRKQRDALAKQLELLIDETRALADTAAQVAAAESRVRQAQTAVEVAELRLERMTVRAPMTGRVLDLLAAPGTRIVGMRPGAEPSAGSVVSLYEPAMLQVRADVRLEDVPLVRPGQPVRIETASSEEPITGTVLAPTSQANIQKNTLEVKVALDAPPDTVRPEMLVTATFLAPERPGSDSDKSEQQERLLVPRRLVQTAGDGHAVWVAAPDGTARRQTVQLGKAGTEELIEVTSGLAPTDKLISGGGEGLETGDRITVTGEDAGAST